MYSLVSVIAIMASVLSFPLDTTKHTGAIPYETITTPSGDTLEDNDNNTLYDYVNFKNDINYLDVMDLSLKISKDRRKKGLSQEQDNNQGKTIKL